MRPRHLIWDWNGTLLDDAWLCRHAINVLLERRRLPALSEERYQEIFAFPLEGYYQAAGFTFETETFDAVGMEFIALYTHQLRNCHLRQGARAFLQDAHGSGLTQAVLSAQEHGMLNQALAHQGILSFFDLVMGVDSFHARGKIEQGARLMEQLRWKPRSCVLVGDTLHDVDVARSLGVDCVLIEGGNQSRSRLAAAGVPVLADLAALRAELGLPPEA